MTETTILAAADARAIFIGTLWGETRNEPIEGIVAVGCVIRNRVHAQYGGSSYREVCLAPWQFSCWRAEGGKANHQALMVLMEQVVAGAANTGRAYRECAWVADGIFADVIRNRVGLSRHYHTAALNPPPAWAVGKTPAYRVGGHFFYTDIP